MSQKTKDNNHMSTQEYREYLLSKNKNSPKKTRMNIKTNGKKSVSSQEVKELNSNEKKSKYNSKITYVDGIMFHSRWEAKRYSILKIMEKLGEIENLELQVAFPIIINEIKVTTYVADFKYFDKEKKETIIEDSKGFITPEYQIKKKLMKAVNGIDIFETREMKKTYNKTNKRR